MSKKSFPVGTQDYRELRMDNYYTIDKTMMIKEFLERKTKVTLITRPRRFGIPQGYAMAKHLICRGPARLRCDGRIL